MLLLLLLQAVVAVSSCCIVAVFMGSLVVLVSLTFCVAAHLMFLFRPFLVACLLLSPLCLRPVCGLQQGPDAGHHCWLPHQNRLPLQSRSAQCLLAALCECASTKEGKLASGERGKQREGQHWGKQCSQMYVADLTPGGKRWMKDETRPAAGNGGRRAILQHTGGWWTMS